MVDVQNAKIHLFSLIVNEGITMVIDSETIYHGNLGNWQNSRRNRILKSLQGFPVIVTPVNVTLLAIPIPKWHFYTVHIEFDRRTV